MEEVLLKLMLITALFISISGFFMIKLHYIKSGLLVLFLGFIFATLALQIEMTMFAAALIGMISLYYPIVKALSINESYNRNHNKVSPTH